MCDEYDDCVYVDNVKIEPVYNGEYYTVTFIDGVDGSVISEVSVPEGGSANLPTPPVHEGYTFSHWEGTYQNVSADSTVTAVYTATVSWAMLTVTAELPLRTQSQSCATRLI